MRLSIQHTTRYRFAAPAAYGLLKLRLTPKSIHGQAVLEWNMDLSGAREELSYDDHNANHTHLISLLPDTPEVVINCAGIVDTVDHGGVLGRDAGHQPVWAFLAQTPLTRPGKDIRALVAPLRKQAGGPLSWLHDLSAAIGDKVAFAKGGARAARAAGAAADAAGAAGAAGATAEEACQAGQGAGPDHAHIFISGARALNIPARYVSGYLLMDDKARQEGAHSWAEAHIEGLGWVGFDVSNGICPDERYVRVATGRDSKDAAPVTAINARAGHEKLSVELLIEKK